MLCTVQGTPQRKLYCIGKESNQNRRGMGRTGDDEQCWLGKESDPDDERNGKEHQQERRSISVFNLNENCIS